MAKTEEERFVKKKQKALDRIKKGMEELEEIGAVAPPPAEFDIPDFMGCTVLDVVHDQTGFVVQKIECFTECVHFVLQWMDEKGELRSAECDFTRLDLVEDATNSRVPVIPPERTDIQLGYVYRDRLSGYVGMAHMITTKINGKVKVLLEKKDSTGQVKVYWAEAEYLEISNVDPHFDIVTRRMCAPPSPSSAVPAEMMPGGKDS